MGDEAPAGDVDEIGAVLGCPRGDGRRLLGVEAAGGVIRGRDAHEQRHLLADLGAHGVDDSQQ
ncbi:hypothetical protein D3C73_1534440 [compost metagenome]